MYRATTWHEPTVNCGSMLGVLLAFPVRGITAMASSRGMCVLRAPDRLTPQGENHDKAIPRIAPINYRLKHRSRRRQCTGCKAARQPRTAAGRAAMRGGSKASPTNRVAKAAGAPARVKVRARLREWHMGRLGALIPRSMSIGGKRSAWRRRCGLLREARSGRRASTEHLLLWTNNEICYSLQGT